MHQKRWMEKEQERKSVRGGRESNSATTAVTDAISHP
jgi:hypothetical protein